MPTFYGPEDGVAADFVPFFWRGAYHLFYLKDYRDEARHGQGTPWFHLVSQDLLQFDDWGEALERGDAGSQDVWVFTGSVVERQGTFYIYYTGHNQNLRGTGQPVQAVMRASSPDLRTWTKDPSFRFYAPTDRGYEADDWRDPFVFWNEEASEYWMLLAARKKIGPSRHRGCIALASSPDLESWEVREPFWAPDLYYTHECPDLFRLGEWWYLVYSTFSERSVTHYRMSRSLKGPWAAPANDTFDGRAFYAAKTAGDAQDRYIFGWLPTRVGQKDDGAWQWGGNLVVHELHQRPDGTLGVRPPQSVVDSFDKMRALRFGPELGEWQYSGDHCSASAVGRFSALHLGTMANEGMLSLTVTCDEGTAACGLLLRASADLESYYQLRIEPANARIVLDRWPRPGDQPFMLERPLNVAPGRPVRLSVLFEGTCLVVYAEDEVALSGRMYEHAQGMIGCFVSEGKARFEGISLATK